MSAFRRFPAICVGEVRVLTGNLYLPLDLDFRRCPSIIPTPWGLVLAMACL